MASNDIPLQASLCHCYGFLLPTSTIEASVQASSDIFVILICQSQNGVPVHLAPCRCNDQSTIKAKQVLLQHKLPPVLPIVLYNGEALWTAGTNSVELIPKAPGLVSQFLLRMEYLLIAENHYTEASLAPMQNLVAAMMRLQRPLHQTMMLELIGLLNL